MARRLYGFLAVFATIWLVGCNEDATEGVNYCGNGVIDGDEECDGTVFVPGVDVCPQGMLRTSESFKCTSSCRVDISRACNIDTCGDGIVNGFEWCDGREFADGAKVCPDGMLLVDSGAFACTDRCQVDFSKACKPSLCGDGIVNGIEQCDGTAFAENLNCPDGLEKIVGGAFKCTETCQLDLSQACMVPVCGDNVLTEKEGCDGELIAEWARECRPGYRHIEGREFKCLDNCQVSYDSACAPIDALPPNLYFSEIQMVPFAGRHEYEDGESVKLLFLEIGNVGSATNLRDCSVVGLEPVAEVGGEYHPKAIFEIPLTEFSLGTSYKDKSQVYGVCIESTEGWLDSQLFKTHYTREEECQEIMSYTSKCLDYCYAQVDADSKKNNWTDDEIMDALNTCDHGCSLAGNYLINEESDRCQSNVLLTELLNSCNVIAVDPGIALKYDGKSKVKYAKMFKSAEGIGGLGIRCGSKIYDVLTLGGISRGSRMCKKSGDLTTIEPTGAKRVGNEAAPYDERESNWLYTHSSDLSLKRAMCGDILTVIN